MRKKKRQSKLAPYAIGIGAGYGAALVLTAIAAAALTITDTASAAASAAALLAVSVGCFISGRVTGKIRRQNGLKTGTLCGILFIVPLIVFSLIFGLAGSVMLFVKALLCVIFGAAGGVSGVNSAE